MHIFLDYILPISHNTFCFFLVVICWDLRLSYLYWSLLAAPFYSVLPHTTALVCRDSGAENVQQAQSALQDFGAKDRPTMLKTLVPANLDFGAKELIKWYILEPLKATVSQAFGVEEVWAALLDSGAARSAPQIVQRALKDSTAIKIPWSMRNEALRQNSAQLDSGADEASISKTRILQLKTTALLGFGAERESLIQNRSKIQDTQKVVWTRTVQDLPKCQSLDQAVITSIGIVLWVSGVRNDHTSVAN